MDCSVPGEENTSRGLRGSRSPQAQREAPRPSSLHAPHLLDTLVGRSHAESWVCTSRAGALWVKVLCPAQGPGTKP